MCPSRFVYSTNHIVTVCDYSVNFGSHVPFFHSFLIRNISMLILNVIIKTTESTIDTMQKNVWNAYARQFVFSLQ